MLIKAPVKAYDQEEQAKDRARKKRRAKKRVGV
jgi:hypothetical protein